MFPPVYVRAAYALFFVVQIMLSIQNILRPKLSITHTECWPHSWTAPACLGVIYFLGRSQSLATDIGRSLIKLFLVHNIGAFLLVVYNVDRSHYRVGEAKLLQVIVGLQLFWIICGALGVMKVYGTPLVTELLSK